MCTIYVVEKITNIRWRVEGRLACLSRPGLHAHTHLILLKICFEESDNVNVLMLNDPNNENIFMKMMINCKADIGNPL